MEASPPLVDEELDAVLNLENAPRDAIVVHNISAHADFGVPLNLAEMIRCFGNAVYEPQEFHCVRIDVRVRTSLGAATRQPDSRGFPGIEAVLVTDCPRTPGVAAAIARRLICAPAEHLKRFADLEEFSTVKMSVFSNGKVSLTGAKSLLAIAVCLEKVCRAIRRRINKAARVRSVMPTNILAVYHFPSHVVLQAFEKSVKGAVYDPFRFAGVRLRLPVKSSTTAYDIRALIARAFGKEHRQGPLAALGKPGEPGRSEDSDSFEDSSDEESVMPALGQPQPKAPAVAQRAPVAAPSPPGVSAMTAPGRQRQLKGNLRRIISDALPSNKRRIHQGASTTPAPLDVGGKKPRLAAAGRPVWFSESKSTLADFDTPKDEVVTIAVYTSGNVTFTGARSIASIQTALSHIYPFLQNSTARNVL